LAGAKCNGREFKRTGKSAGGGGSIRMSAPLMEPPEGKFHGICPLIRVAHEEPRVMS
jgi:hypothetical protein